ncbi:MAG: MarR family transcriptional regulator [Eubacteriales bacterium]
MIANNDFLELITNNFKKLFFPEEWLNLDMKFSKSELFTILQLDRREEITMTELAETIGAPMSTATGIVDRLVRNQYLKRERSEEDRRVVVLKLTDKGISLSTELKELISQYTSMVLEDLTDEEQRFLVQIILKIFKTLQTHRKSTNGEMKNDSDVRNIIIE